MEINNRLCHKREIKTICNITKTEMHYQIIETKRNK